MKKILFFALFFSLGFNLSSFAETVKLKSGKTIQGKITERTEKNIMLELDNTGIGLTFYHDEIESIDGNIFEKTPVPEVTAAGSVDAATAAALPDSMPSDKKYSDDPQINDLINKTIANYRNLQSFAADGKTVSKIKTQGVHTTMAVDFSIKLARPNLYLVSWTTDSPASAKMQGAIWNAGEGAYTYQSMFNNYQKMSTDESALGAGAGVSSGATQTTPVLFLGLAHNIFDSLKNIKLKDPEKINGQDCYVLTGESPISYDETLWISKDNGLILKTAMTYGKIPDPSEQQKLSGEEMATSLKDMGLEATEENKQKLTKMMEMSQKIASQIKIEGTHEEFYNHIDINPELAKTEFVYALPKDAKLDNSIYKNALNNLDSMMQSMQLSQGIQLNHQQAQELEEKVKLIPNDLDSRFKLIGYYLGKNVNAANKARQKHILWIIENKPDFEGGEMVSSFMTIFPQTDGEAYQQAKNLWLKHLEKSPQNKSILINAASFFRFGDKELSDSLFKKVKEIDPSYQSMMEMLGDAAKKSH